MYRLRPTLIILTKKVSVCKCVHWSCSISTGQTQCEGCPAGKTTVPFVYDKVFEENALTFEECIQARQYFIDNDKSRDDWASTNHVSQINNDYSMINNIAVLQKLWGGKEPSVCGFSRINLFGVSYAGFQYTNEVSGRCDVQDNADFQVICIKKNPDYGCVDCAAGKYSDVEGLASAKTVQ